MSAQVTIAQLPLAGAITGTELVPVVQNGVTVQTTTAALAGSPVQTQTFITKNQEPTLANSRALSNGTGIGLVDGGAQSTLQITLNAASGSLEAASNGMIAKTASNAVVARTMVSSTTGLSVTNGDGVAGAPAFALTGVALAVAGATGTGALALTGPTTVSTRTILGTTSQIAVTDGNFANSPVIAIASDPILPGNGGLVVPVGTTGQRGSSTNGNLRYNTTTATFEGYANNAWGSITTGTGVTSVATGTGLTGGPITSTGTISIDVTGVSAATYGSSLVVPVIAVNAQGQITSATNTTINAVTLTTGTISTTPSGSTDIANKSYVDTVAQGLDTKASVVAGTTVNITLSGTQTIDGIVLIAGDRVLVKNQTASADNGLYLCAAGAWTRTTDMNTWAQVPGAYVFVETGTTLADTGWVCTSNAGGTIGVTAITWAQFSGAGSGVSSITFGSTGLTPATATTGAVTVAGTLALTNGGSGQTTAQLAINAFAGAVTSGSYLRGNGTNVVMNTIQVADVPTLNQNTSGTAAGLSATLAIASGGTGQTTASAAFNALSPITTTGDLIIGTGVNTASRLGIGANGYLLTSDGTTASWVAAPASGVTTFSAGTTGLTPSSATGGAITLAGTLAVANGGTGLTAGTSGGVLAYTATGTLASSALLAANAVMVGGGAGVAPSTVTTGTGVVTALGVNTGTAGAFVVNGGALGTPSSGTVTNLTGTASININGTVGATTTNTGAFTTVAATTVTATTGIFGGTF
jgi:hypothetical protein